MVNLRTLGYLQLILLVFLSVISCTSNTQKTDNNVEFVISYTDEVSTSPISGRIILLLSADTLVDPDIPSPYNPFITLGMDFKNWKPGDDLILNGENVTTFLSTFNDLKGPYSVRAMLDLDTTSCNFLRDGTCFSDMEVINIESDKNSHIKIEVNNVLSGFGFNESENVKLLKTESKLLSDFYNSPTYIEAAVILPQSYFKDTEKYYPTVFVFPGFGTTHTNASQDDFQQKRYGANGFGEEKIFVLLNQDCRYGFHVFANSENNGPRAKSFIEEFLPDYEKTYRAIKKTNARFLVGHSSGAWASLWLLINYPDEFGMAWAGSPDPVDFRDFIGHNLYEKDANIFYDKDGELTPAIRSTEISFTNKDWSDMESALGEGGQYQSFEAVFGRKGADGKPEQVFDRETGKISQKAFEHWKQYDINKFITENPKSLLSSLAGKINIVVAQNDNFFLEGAVELLSKSLDSLGLDANIKFLTEGGHNTWTNEIRTEMHNKMDKISSGK